MVGNILNSTADRNKKCDYAEICNFKHGSLDCPVKSYSQAKKEDCIIYKIAKKINL